MITLRRLGPRRPPNYNIQGPAVRGLTILNYERSIARANSSRICWALVRRLQWVALGGFWRVVLRMILSTLSAPTAGLRPGCGASFPTPAWTKRFRQRATNWQTDTCAAIGLFCRPSAASKTILAHSARRTATRRPRAYPFHCLRWVSVSVTRGAVRISSSYQIKTLRTIYK